MKAEVMIKMKIFVTDKYRVLTFMLICTVIGIGAILSRGGSQTVSNTPRIIPIYSVERDDNKLAVTFDCAWGSDDIDSILSTLKKHDCKATFFVLGTWAEKNSDAMKKIVSEGHEIGNHSYNHTHYTTLTSDKMLEDIKKANESIKKSCGISPVLFRAPSGDYNNTVIEVCHSAQMEYIQWSLDSLDWRNLSCEQMMERIVPKAKSGDILLFHNGTKYTAKSLDSILTALEGKGFSFARVSDIIYKENYITDHTGRQIPK
ncbi:MAG: polysaccharide deacetylase family protein [Clostridia bacterium]|nr:polysaccharide deacetylase family protein [Clostridia bacterium]